MVLYGEIQKGFAIFDGFVWRKLKGVHYILWFCMEKVKRGSLYFMVLYGEIQKGFNIFDGFVWRKSKGVHYI